MHSKNKEYPKFSTQDSEDHEKKSLQEIEYKDVAIEVMKKEYEEQIDIQKEYQLFELSKDKFLL